jgi:hypothetical protein
MMCPYVSNLILTVQIASLNVMNVTSNYLAIIYRDSSWNHNKLKHICLYENNIYQQLQSLYNHLDQ